MKIFFLFLNKSRWTILKSRLELRYKQLFTNILISTSLCIACMVSNQREQNIGSIGVYIAGQDCHHQSLTLHSFCIWVFLEKFSLPCEGTCSFVWSPTPIKCPVPGDGIGKFPSNDDSRRFWWPRNIHKSNDHGGKQRCLFCSPLYKEFGRNKNIECC